MPLPLVPHDGVVLAPNDALKWQRKRERDLDERDGIGSEFGEHADRLRRFPHEGKVHAKQDPIEGFGGEPRRITYPTPGKFSLEIGSSPCSRVDACQKRGICVIHSEGGRSQWHWCRIPEAEPNMTRNFFNEFSCQVVE